VLEFAIRHRLPVLIDYVNAQGGTSTRVIEPSMRLGPVVVAWCRLRQAERNFALARITAASPVEA
jgi:predicted DNA-binding transcriptional regulator YafY